MTEPTNEPTAASSPDAEHTEPIVENTASLPAAEPASSSASESAPAPAPVSKASGRTTTIVIAAVVGLVAGLFGASLVSLSHRVASTTLSAVSTGGKSAPTGAIEQVAAKVLPSVVQISVTSANVKGSGSGIILDTDGNILTNNHVVALASGGGALAVSFADGTTVGATVVGADSVTDLAVIQVKGVNNLQPATIGHSNALHVGQEVMAVGSPFGLEATVTSGIVSALNRPVAVTADDQTPQGGPLGQLQQQKAQQAPSTIYPAIQTDAAINPGNSGGPLVNLDGQVVGVTSSIRTSGSAGGSIGLGFAIPIDEALPIVNQVMQHQTPTHARLGVSVGDLTGNTLQQGAQIHAVDANGVAQGAGLKVGDIITKVDNDVISSADGVVATVRGHRPGDKVQITYVRNGSSATLSVTLGSDAAAKTS